MALVDVTQPVAQIVQSAAVVLGGAWAYAKYVRGRTFRPRAKLDVTATLDRVNGDAVLIACVSMENQGLGRLGLEDDLSLLFVDAVPMARWRPGANPDWDEATPIMVSPVFTKHGWIEPGETIADQLLVPLPRSDVPPVAYQTRAWVRAPRRLRKSGIAWSANAVVPVRVRPLASPQGAVDTASMAPEQEESSRDEADEARRQAEEQRRRDDAAHIPMPQAMSPREEADEARRQAEEQRLWEQQQEMPPPAQAQSPPAEAERARRWLAEQRRTDAADESSEKSPTFLQRLRGRLRRH